MADKPRKPLDATEMLMQDHREVESLFREFASLKRGAEAAGALVQKVCAELTIYAVLETEIFYPAVHEAAEAEEVKALLDDGEDRLDAMSDLIAKVVHMDATDAKLGAQFTKLSGQMARHIGEEESKLFPQVQKLKALDVAAVTAEMKERKRELIIATGVAEEDAETA